MFVTLLYPTQDFKDYNQKCYEKVKWAFAQTLDYPKLGPPGKTCKV